MRLHCQLRIIELRFFALTDNMNGTSVLLRQTTTSKIASADFTRSFVAFDELDSSRHVDVLTQAPPVGDDIPWIFKYVAGDVSQIILKHAF